MRRQRGNSLLRVLRVSPVAGAFATLVAIAACTGKPSAGDKCKNPGRYVCSDKDTALYCKDGVFTAIPCRGPRGCVGGAESPKCDYDFASEGDACMSPANENYACSLDRAVGLVCKDGKFVRWRACKGPHSCVVHPDRIECDNTYADVGDPCGSAGSYACSADKKLALVCKNGKYEADGSCRGPDECRVGAQAHKLECDESVAEMGDPCATDDEVTCSVDKKSELVCKAHVFVKKRDCTRKDGCVYQKSAPPLCAN